MPEQERRHAAIVFTDIVGYTALMGSDEDRAFEVLAKNRELHKLLIKKFGGKLIKEMGDGMLISFNLASDAVRCAIEIQKACKQQDIPLKIGIHEGEMVFEGSDVLGDGVNIASRLQDDTNEGCITISGSVYRDIKNKTDIKTEFIGEMSFKNVDDPIKVYKVFCEEIQRKNISPLISEQNIPEKKSIIVLPFVNMSPDPDQEYFSDGLTEEIITDLSHIHDLLVISRNSAMTFKGSKKTTKEVASMVNAQFVLEGSVRKSGSNLRITAQLIDGLNDTHLWAEKYRGTLEDVFEIQEKVSRSIADALKIELSPKVYDRITSSKIDNIQAYECYLKARHEIFLLREESFDEALKFIDKGLKIVGDHELLYSIKTLVYIQYVNLMSKPPTSFEGLLIKAQANASRSLETNPNSAPAHFAQGCTFHQQGNPKGAMEHFSRAISIDPNYSDALLMLGYHYVATGLNKEEGRRLLEKASVIDPLTLMSASSEGWYYLFNGNYNVAVKKFYDWQKSMEAIKSPILILLAWVHALNRDLDEAIRIIDNIIIHKPNHVMAAIGSFMKSAWRGDKEKALNFINEQLINAAWWDDVYSMMMSEAFASIDELDKSFKWLEHAIDYGCTNEDFLVEHDHFLDKLKSDKRFEKMLDKVKSIHKQFTQQDL